MRDKFWQAGKMDSLHLIDREFGVNLFRIKKAKDQAKKEKHSYDTAKIELRE